MSRFLKACRRQAVDATPVWFMRQAGRYQARYREIRQKFDLPGIVRNPEVCAEVTLLPVDQLGVDAAILFADIMTPLQAVGVPVEIKKGVGPVLADPIRSEAGLDQIRPLEPDQDVWYVLKTIQLLRQDLNVPLIGFAGGPFTLASYLVEGGPSRRFTETKRLMFKTPQTWHSLMERLTAMTITYLQAQAEAGAEAIQLFDSWIGCLSPDDYAQFVLPYSTRVFKALESTGIPRIHFGVGTAELLPLMKETGADVVGADWAIHINAAWERIGFDTAIQGNLEPETLLGDWALVQNRTEDILKRVGGRPGHIFNLGHGVLPDTDPDRLRRLVDFVHERTSG